MDGDLDHITLDGAEIGSQLAAATLFSTEGSQFQSIRSLFHTVNQDDTRQSHVIGEGGTVRCPVIGLGCFSNSEVRQQIPFSGHCKSISSIYGDLFPILYPVDEAKTFICRSRQSNQRTKFVITITGYHAAFRRIRCSVDVEIIWLDGAVDEVSYQNPITINCEGILGFGGNHLSVLRPVVEDVSLVGQSGQNTSFIPCVGSCS